MFVPSESVYAELHDGFDDVVQKAYRAKVVIVSPSLLMLAIQRGSADPERCPHARGRRQIRDEVGRLMKDVGLLRRPRAQAADSISTRRPKISGRS